MLCALLLGMTTTSFGGQTMPAYVQHLGKQAYTASFSQPNIGDLARLYVRVPPSFPFPHLSPQPTSFTTVRFPSPSQHRTTFATTLTTIFAGTRSCPPRVRLRYVSWLPLYPHQIKRHTSPPPLNWRVMCSVLMWQAWWSNSETVATG
jgi:hypothetical protein